jgi:hypothetical protein
VCVESKDAEGAGGARVRQGDAPGGRFEPGEFVEHGQFRAAVRRGAFRAYLRGPATPRPEHAVAVAPADRGAYGPPPARTSRRKPAAVSLVAPRYDGTILIANCAVVHGESADALRGPDAPCGR